MGPDTRLPLLDVAFDPTVQIALGMTPNSKKSTLYKVLRQSLVRAMNVEGAFMSISIFNPEGTAFAELRYLPTETLGKLS